MVPDLALDSLDESSAYRVRRNHQALVVGRQRVAGQDIEQFAHVVADSGVGGQQTDVFVEPGGLGVVVTGTDVRVAT